MARDANHENQVAVRLMDSDFTFARRFLDNVINDPKNTMIPLFCMNNYISLFIYESHKTLKKIDPARAAQLDYDHGVIIERVRHTVKLFKDTAPDKGMVGVAQYFEELLAATRKYFLSSVWLPPARRWVKDLGVWSYHDRLVTTTHVAHFYLGAMPQQVGDPKSLGPTFKAVAESQGKYVAGFLGGQPWQRSPTFVDAMDLDEIENKDVKFGECFEGAFDPTFDEGLVGALAAFRCALNFLDVMLSGDTGGDSAETVFKLKYVTLYHVIASLAELKKHHAASLNARSLGIVDAILSHSTTVLMMARSSVGLRNTLIHYRPVASVAAQLSLNLPLCGLAEAYFPGYDFATLSQEVNEHTVRVAELFEEWAHG